VARDGVVKIWTTLAITISEPTTQNPIPTYSQLREGAVGINGTPMASSVAPKASIAA
jgi:hypothetical protein